MANTAGGIGGAANASVLTSASSAELETALRDAREREINDAPRLRVERAEGKVAKFEAHVAGARDELKAARAALKGT